jgi:predicted dithiol-disulfide oxidoreductase (DUF899 family)
VSTHIEDLNAMNHSVVSEERWLAERKALLAREKALTQLQGWSPQRSFTSSAARPA